MSATALIVDDEVDLCRLMQMTLTKMGIQSDVAYDVSTARQYLDHSQYDFCLTDMRLPDGSGLELVKLIADNYCDMPVAVITAHGNMDIAIEALKLGAFDFVNKPLELPRLRQLIEHALRVTKEGQDTSDSPNLATPCHTELKTPKKSNADLLLDKYLIGNSPAIVKLKSTIIKLARSQAPVFLWGESGTGKEVVAKLIHRLSPRRESEFVAVNCGAIPSELMESEFFGHKRGSFTGATTDKNGLFQQADGGTLFLDEVADLPLSMQVKLLRAIQEKSVRAIGDTKEVPVDVRILSATHKDLNQLVQEGKFRQDLFYRINVIELKLPKLNERGSDIELLTHFFLEQIADEWQLETTPTLTADAQTALHEHHYEGNVRELRNLLERAITLADSDTLNAEHLGLSAPSVASHGEQVIPSSQIDCAPAHTTDGTNYADVGKYSLNSDAHTITNLHTLSATPLEIDGLNNIHTHTKATPDTATTLSPVANQQQDERAPTIHYGDDSLDDSHRLPQEGLECYLQERERELIIIALNQTNWNKTQAAKLLGTSFRSLRYRMKKLNIEAEDDNE